MNSLVRRRSCGTEAEESPKSVRSWCTEIVGGFEFGRTSTNTKPMPTRSSVDVVQHSDEYVVYACTEIDGAPDLDSVRTRRSFEIG